jgi:hypothetical protein
MTDIEVLGAFGLILSFFALLAGLVVAFALAANHLAYWWEDRHTEHDLHRDLIDRVETYTLDAERVA